MKVLCIDDSKGRIRGKIPTFKFGDTLLVIEVQKDYAGVRYYLIKGHEFCEGDDVPTMWDEKRFAPLSDIEETELAKEREQLQTV